jgi:hypothetical protein
MIGPVAVPDTSILSADGRDPPTGTSTLFTSIVPEPNLFSDLGQMFASRPKPQNTHTKKIQILRKLLTHSLLKRKAIR